MFPICDLSSRGQRYLRLWPIMSGKKRFSRKISRLETFRLASFHFIGSTDQLIKNCMLCFVGGKLKTHSLGSHASIKTAVFCQPSPSSEKNRQIFFDGGLALDTLALDFENVRGQRIIDLITKGFRFILLYNHYQCFIKEKWHFAFCLNICQRYSACDKI